MSVLGGVDRRRLLLIGLFGAVTIAALGVFGEREHWAVLLLLPHLAATVLGHRVGPRAERAALRVRGGVRRARRAAGSERTVMAERARAHDRMRGSIS